MIRYSITNLRHILSCQYSPASNGLCEINDCITPQSKTNISDCIILKMVAVTEYPISRNITDSYIAIMALYLPIIFPPYIILFLRFQISCPVTISTLLIEHWLFNQYLYFFLMGEYIKSHSCLWLYRHKSIMVWTVRVFSLSLCNNSFVLLKSFFKAWMFSTLFLLFNSSFNVSDSSSCTFNFLIVLSF